MASDSGVVQYFFSDTQKCENSTMCTLKSSVGTVPIDLIEIILSFLRIYMVLFGSLVLTYYFRKPKLLRYVSELAFCFTTFFLLSPVFIVIIFATVLTRFVLSIHFLRQGAKVKLMSGADAFWAYEEFANSSCFNAVYVLEGECDIAKVRKRVMDGLVRKIVNGQELYKRLSCRIITKFGFPCWEKIEEIDVERHIPYISHGCDGPMTDARVHEELAKIYDYPLPNSRPQWEVLVVPDYVYSNQKTNKKQYAVIFRVHHSYMDGISAGIALQTALSDASVKLAIDPLKPWNISRFQKIMAYTLVMIGGPRAFLRTLLLDEKNCFHDGRSLTGPKVLGWSRPVKLTTLTAIKNKTKTSTTAVLISSLGSAFRHLAAKKKLPLPRLINSFVTVAILPYPDSGPQNRFAVSLFPIIVGLSSSLERLKAAYTTASDLAKSPDILTSFCTMSIAGLFPALVTKFISSTVHSTFLLSNVPGPCEEIRMFEGDRLLDIGIWAPIRSKIGIGLSLFSYNGRIRATMVGDSTALPDSSDIPSLIQGFEKEIQELSSMAGIPTQDVFWEE